MLLERHVSSEELPDLNFLDSWSTRLLFLPGWHLLFTEVILGDKCLVERRDNESVLGQHENLWSLEFLHSLALLAQLVDHLLDHLLQRVVISEVSGDVFDIDDFTSIRKLVRVVKSLFFQRFFHLLHELELDNFTLRISTLLQLAQCLLLLAVDLNLCLFGLVVLGPLTLLLPHLPSDSCLLGCVSGFTLFSLLVETRYVTLDLVVEVRAYSFLVAPITDTLGEASCL